MVRTRIAVLVSGGGTNLQALMDAEKKGILKSGEIVLVISDKKEAFALERAAKEGKKHLYIEGGNEEKIIEALKEHDIDMIVLAGFMSILSEKFTGKYEGRIINVHPSLIPSFCGRGYYGLKVHKAALEYGVMVTGATVHYVNEIPDGGRIIKQKAVYVKEDDTPESLQRRVMEEAEWIILPEAAELVAEKIAGEK